VDMEKLRSIFEASLKIENSGTLDDLLRRLVQAACNLTNAEYGAIGVIGKAGNLIRFITHGLSEGEIEAIGEYPRGRGILGLLITDPRPIRIHDISMHPRHAGIPKNHPKITSFLGVPIFIRERTFGNFYLGNKKDGPDFTEGDESLLISLAALASIAIENYRLHEQSKEVLVLQDRARIAADLHDIVIQRLFAAGISLQSTVSKIENREISETIQKAIDDIEGVIFSVRESIFSLSNNLDRTKIKDEILSLAADMSVVLGFLPEVSFRGNIELDFSQDHIHDITAILREALVNVARHAQATKVAITVEVKNGEFLLSVIDNGIGIPDFLSRLSGTANMLKRANQLKGNLTFSNLKDRGTEVRFTMKLPDSSGQLID
jgi:signal transduction histidine kinase